MAPIIAVMAIAVVVFLQVLFLAHNTPERSSVQPMFLPSSTINHEDIEAVLTTPRKPFPRKIWQTSKNGPANLDDLDKEAIQTWTKLNQKWRYEAITQYSAESYVKESFMDRPEIVETFIDLQDPILRADMIRYLVLLKDGGLYSDLDTKSLKPIEDWIPVQYQAETSVVIGVEYDRLKGDRWSDWTLDLQFTTWSILAKSGHPLLELTVQKVMRNLKDLAIQQGTTIAKVRASFDQVLDATGPAAFSRAVFEYLSHELGEQYTWDNVTDLKVPLLVSDVLILPITAFGCGQWHSNARGPEDSTALVQHLFKGSWKGDHRFQPVDAQSQEEETKRQKEQEEEIARQKIEAEEEARRLSEEERKHEEAARLELETAESDNQEAKVNDSPNEGIEF
ncbi:MAG: hypothetical protein GOMPHAMPRED_001416 [Gomphillus americanus]|uniref:Uncharacterized protein n=1 Tax=Gomphillus americanus TaxID=1940652 RepID=A0A8H3FBV7_9LECA|nr:MAG: hypothetical protein GOMPHAMPRED_001416 [Gomphillus americanus]